MSFVTNGTSQYLSLASSLVGNSPAVYTLAAWVKGAAQSDKRVIAFGHNPDTGAFLTFGTGSGTTSRARFLNRPDSGADQGSDAPSGTAYDGTWHHVALVINGTSAKAYIDGTSVLTDGTSVWTPTIASGLTYTLNRSAIGALLRATAGNFFAGKIAEAGIWTSDQSANMAALGNATAAHRPNEYPSGLVGYLSLLNDATDTMGNVWTNNGSAAFDNTDHPVMVSTGDKGGMLMLGF